MHRKSNRRLMWNYLEEDEGEQEGNRALVHCLSSWVEVEEEINVASGGNEHTEGWRERVGRVN